MWKRFKRWLCPPAPPKSQTEAGQRILGQLSMSDLYTESGWANPLDHIGMALTFAKAHGIELAPGISFGTCRAYIPKERWKAVPTVPYIPMGDWVDRPDPCEAICVCALNCRELGIL